MIRYARSIARRAFGRLGRPFAGRAATVVRAEVDGAIVAHVHPPIGLILENLSLARQEVGAYRNETNLLLEGLVREVSRLQDELELLRAEIAERDRGGLGLASVEDPAMPRGWMAESA